MKNNPPFFTVISAVKNSDSTIGYTLESVRNQIFKDMEHIVIDGGSDDQTLDILKSYQSAYNLTYLSEPDDGIADALNKGLRLARGKYILVIQGDDRLLNSKIFQDVYRVLKTQEYAIYSCPVIFDHPIKGKVIRKPIRLLWYLHFKFILPHQGCFVHRRVFEEIGGFRKEFSIGMDYDFFYRAIFSGHSIAFGRKPIALMGGVGLGSDPRLLGKRLVEERRVQVLNEKNRIWKMAQQMFFMFYMPYKKLQMKMTAGLGQNNRLCF